ncbi:MAG: HK97 family phage prohead protease, partial [Mesorhizobium sp.]
PPMLIQHGGWGLGDMDGLAIGRWTSMEEDDTGLAVEGKLIGLDTERGKIIHGAMKEGVLDGMSIGYRAKEFTLGTKPEEPRRLLKKIDLVELSVVQMPANGAARVAQVKSAGIRTIR